MPRQAVQKALVAENVIQILSTPLNLHNHSTVTIGDGEEVVLKGFGAAHFAALQYVNRLLSEAEDIEPQSEQEKHSWEVVKKRCVRHLPV